MQLKEETVEWSGGARRLQASRFGKFVGVAGNLVQGCRERQS
jgi:hypothetical protein